MSAPRLTNPRTRGLVIAAGLAVFVLLLAGCATRNPLTGTPGLHGVAGFFTGLGHGLIAPIAFVWSLFDHRWTMYEVHNNGAWYNAGFLIGAGAWGILRGPSKKS